MSFIFVAGIIERGICGVGDVDNRYYVTDDMWATPPYNSFVKLTEVVSENLSYGCTGQYIAKNLILSAGHCTLDKPIRFEATNYKKQRFRVRLLETKWNSSKRVRQLGDWAIFLIENPQYYLDTFLDPTIPTQTTEVINAGYGYVRILGPEDIQVIRQILGDEHVNEKVDFDRFINIFEDQLSEKGFGLLQYDSDRLKASKCNVVFEDCSKNMTKACNNQNLRHADNFPQILATTCDSWQGNSGGGYVSGNKVLGICSYGVDSFGDMSNTDYMASTKQFMDAYIRLKSQYPALDADTTTPENTSGQTSKQPTEQRPITPIAELKPISGILTTESLIENLDTQIPSLDTQIPSLETLMPSGPTQGDIDNLTQIVQEQEENILAKLPSAGNLSDTGIMAFVDQIVEHQITKSRLDALIERYNEAKENEQSLANRTLTAATTAATGLGMMTAASARAEQKADADAEQDMSAYLATFKCEYGRGLTAKAGNEEITLPGGNELLEYYSEYKSLADNLKNTKKALGLRPGIEQEIVYDKAQSNLYKYSSTGITQGAFTSLSRALTDTEGADAEKWNTQKEESSQKLKGGAVAAGAGVAGGVVGNAAMNTDMIQNIKDAFKK